MKSTPLSTPMAKGTKTANGPIATTSTTTPPPTSTAAHPSEPTMILPPPNPKYTKLYPTPPTTQTDIPKIKEADNQVPTPAKNLKGGVGISGPTTLKNGTTISALTSSSEAAHTIFNTQKTDDEEHKLMKELKKYTLQIDQERVTLNVNVAKVFKEGVFDFVTNLRKSLKRALQEEEELTKKLKYYETDKSCADPKALVEEREKYRDLYYAELKQCNQNKNMFESLKRKTITGGTTNTKLQPLSNGTFASPDGIKPVLRPATSASSYHRSKPL
eukprot:TRINITY_DN6262_c0_g3_i1.p1 TRINITY_DN6262_c0_g3~~TRINITY_DN6262_c0_g3_i1.p1  ORF type:complete len:273 (+),score=24.57 TRINITY_DN6262_c0_g3_i1:199-1017(+)